MASTPEGKIKAKLDKVLKARADQGVWYFNPQSGPFGRSGVPDKILCVRGRVVGIECKADPSKKPTMLQMQCMEKIERAGGKCFVVASDKDIERVAQYLDNIINTTGEVK